MAKFTITFKDTDPMGQGETGLGGTVARFAAQNKLDEDEVDALVDAYIDCGEMVTLQFDTEAGTCTVVKADERGINDWVDDGARVEIDVKWGKTREEEVAELQRQVDEAVATLAKEEDKTTPYAQGLVKFIWDTKKEIELIG